MYSGNMPAIPNTASSSPSVEEQLSVIMDHIEQIRISVKEERGQGFLINAEKNILCFLQLQKTPATGKGDTK